MTYSLHIPHLQATVSGIASLRKQSFARAVGPEDTVLFQTAHCVIVATGAVPGVENCPTDDVCALLVGRVYTPCFSMRALADEATRDILTTPALLRDLEGSFRFVQFSSRNGDATLLLATDRFGSRRLLYTVRNDTLYFSTHLNALSRLLPEGTFNVSRRALLHYYNFGFTPNDATLIEGIGKVPPGSCLEFSREGLAVTSYARLGGLFRPEEYASQSIEEATKYLDCTVHRAVRAHYDDGETIGCLLSGGVDSGYIACALRDLGAQVHAYNIAYGDVYNEHDRVDRLVSHLDLAVHKIRLTPRPIIENYHYSNSICSEPVSFNNATIRLAADVASRDGVTCLFDGDGADRLFLGMVRSAALLRAIRMYKRLDHIGLARISGYVARWLPGPEFRKLSNHFLNWSSGIPPYAERRLSPDGPYDREYERHVFQMAIKCIWDEFCTEFPGRIDSHGLFFTFQGIKMCPEMFFCDLSELESDLGIARAAAYWTNDLVSLALSTPVEWKVHANTTKYLLRLAAGYRFDPSYWMLPKIGFQDSLCFCTQSEEGRKWRDQMRREILVSEEYSLLRDMLPHGHVEHDRLLAVNAWRRQNASARWLLGT